MAPSRSVPTGSDTSTACGAILSLKRAPRFHRHQGPERRLILLRLSPVKPIVDDEPTPDPPDPLGGEDTEQPEASEDEPPTSDALKQLREALAALSDNDLIPAFVRLCHRLKIPGMERERVREELRERLKIGKREFNRQEKRAWEVLCAAMKRAREEKLKRERAAQGDHRPRYRVPPEDAPLLAMVTQFDSVFAASTAAEPPMRDVEGIMTVVTVRHPTGLHLLTSATANAEGDDVQPIPPPMHVLMHRLSDLETAEMIERHIDYHDDDGQSKRASSIFARNYRRQALGSPLPVIVSVATMPVILPDGTVLSGHHLDRERCILFRVPEELATLLPGPEERTPDHVAQALSFLTDQWLVDVPTSYGGKLNLVSMACTILERNILPGEKPGFYVTSGRRGNGKTTAITMVSVAVTGQRGSAASWSASSEERRKAMLAHLGDGVPLLCFDNIPRGSMISDPTIDKVLNFPTHTDRVLGSSESRTVSTVTVLCWTGNNIGPRGDNVSRSHVIRLETDRPDPENRKFAHADPIEWTFAHRGQILRALYTVMLGNPRLTAKDNDPAETRFKPWWHLVGAAIEHAAKCHLARKDLYHQDCPPQTLSFRDQALSSDADDELDHAQAIVLRLLLRWGGGFTAAEVIRFVDLNVGSE